MAIELHHLHPSHDDELTRLKARMAELEKENQTLAEDVSDKIESITELMELVEKYKSEKAELEEERRHNKYKRCLAMADMCAEAYKRECGLNPEEMTNKEFYKQQIEFWPRWNYKWLKIGEKFKTNSTINRKGGYQCPVTAKSPAARNRPRSKA